MNLPTHHPPLGWKVSTRAGTIIITKDGGGTSISREHLIAACVAGCFPVLFTVGVQKLSSNLTLGEILSQAQTISLLLFAPLILGIVFVAKRQLSRKLQYALSAELLRFEQIEPGRKTIEEVPRHRVRGLRRYVPEDLDGERLEGVSLVLEWQEPSGKETDLYLGLFEGAQQGEWFTRLFEAWSGRRAVLSEYPPDDEDEGDDYGDDDADGEDTGNRT